jgi:UDP-N-acetylglucosamine 2-epimerase (non-hydrolysing)
MKIVTIFGTRPEIIRLSRVIPEVDAIAEQVLVHTGQNYDPRLSEVFFKELGVRTADVHLGVQASDFAQQAGQILERIGAVLAEHRPERVLILGDTNSGLAAIVAARMRIPVFHMEAGNRCFDDRVPEEINRRIIDHSSTVLMPYTHRSKENLLREGIERQRIYVIGNPIFEVLTHFEPHVAASDVLSRLGLSEGHYYLATLHRAENVDEPQRLERLMQALSTASDTAGIPLVASIHPRTANKLAGFGVTARSQRVRLLEPLGFFDFVQLERHARGVLSDSGTVQEECCIFGVPNVTLRDVTERAETVECGSNIVVGADPELAAAALAAAVRRAAPWRAPAEYLETGVARTVANVLLSHLPRQM